MKQVIYTNQNKEAELYYDENSKKSKKKGDSESNTPTGKFVFFEEKMAVIELELKLCGYFVIVTSERMTAKEALENEVEFSIDVGMIISQIEVYDQVS